MASTEELLERSKETYEKDRLRNEELLRKTKEQNEKNRAYNEYILSILNKSEIPKTNGFTTSSIPGDPGKFANSNMGFKAQPNSWQELDEHSKKLISGEKGFQAQKSILGAPYNIIEQLMGHGYKPGTNDTQGVDNAANISMALMGTGAARAAVNPSMGSEVGAFRPSVRGLSGVKPSSITPEMMTTLTKLSEKHSGAFGKNKNIIRDFLEKHPDYTGTDQNLLRTLNKQKLLGGTNIETGAASSKDIEMGAFGGRGRLNTTSPGESVNWLQSKQPVNKKWVEEWAKDSGVNVTANKTKARGNPTHYLTLEDPANPGNIAKVRIPTDPSRHYGYEQSPSKAGSYFDTGYGYPKEMQAGPNPRNMSEHTLINQSNQSYANPEALDQALRLKFTKAPFGQNPLVSPDYAPIKPPVGPSHRPPDPYDRFKDPNQLKLLSGGYTPFDIINILRQQGGSN